MLLLEEVANLIQSSPKSNAHGAKCHFYEIGGIGIKTWRVREIAEKCFKLQKIIHKLGFAPEVYGELFEAVDHDNASVWCYQTELATVLGSVLPRWSDGDFEDWDHERIVMGDIIHAANLKMRETGWNDFDDHYHNWGVMPDGRIVCIDFDYVEEYSELSEPTPTRSKMKCGSSCLICK